MTPSSPLIIPRSEHRISRADISANALKVLYRLKDGGYQAYLVGGGVRDLLLGRKPKDFDVATDATPDQVRKVFRNCRLIGRRFRLAHIHFGREIVEVATFRGNGRGKETQAEDARHIHKGMIMRDNLYGTREEDALRRDFSVNGLYYNIADFTVIDYAGGLDDLRARRLRLIGDDPERRYREDPVRMLRAVRFACKLGFDIEPSCEQPLFRLGHLLRDVPAARLFDEILKLFQTGDALCSFDKLRHYRLFAQLFPATDQWLDHQDRSFPSAFIRCGLKNTDRRVREGKPITPAFLFAVLLWGPMHRRFARLRIQDTPVNEALLTASREAFVDQQPLVAIPKRLTLPVREIWSLQPRFERREGKYPHRVATHPGFRAAYDFLLLRAEAGEADPELAAWWTRFQAEHGPPPSGPGSKRSATRRRHRRPPARRETKGN